VLLTALVDSSLAPNFVISAIFVYNIMKHILRLVWYYKKTITSTQTNILHWRFGLYQKLLQFFFRFSPR